MKAWTIEKLETSVTGEQKEGQSSHMMRLGEAGIRFYFKSGDKEEKGSDLSFKNYFGYLENELREHQFGGDDRNLSKKCP